jgi:hypothetical protein
MLLDADTAIEDARQRDEAADLVWNRTFVFYCIKVREDFLPIPSYSQN